VFIEGSFGFGMPDLLLLVRKIPPGKTDNFRQSTMICLYFSRNVLTLNKRRSEKNESIRRTRNVILGPLLAMRRAATGRAIDERREEN
jgi:hypothetical protein